MAHSFFDICENNGRGLSPRSVCLESVDSTNRYAGALISDAYSDASPGKPVDARPLVVSSRCQTAGQGRMGRTFYSPPGTGLYMTVAFPLDAPFPRRSAGDAVGMTCGAGALVCDVLSSVSGHPLEIKWVNDILLDGKKVCGILCRTLLSSRPGQPDFLLVGIGVNLTTSVFPEPMRTPPASLFGPADTPPDITGLRDRLAARVLGMALLPDTHPFGIYGRETLAYYRSRSALTGKRVARLFPDGTCGPCGTALDVTDRYALPVLYPDSRTEMYEYGEVSLREQTDARDRSGS